MRAGQLSFGQAATKFGIPKTTLVDRVSGKTTMEGKRGRKQDIPPEIENSIVEVLFAAKSGFSITKLNRSFFKE